MKIAKRQLRKIIREQVMRPPGDAPAHTPGPEAGSMRAARDHLNRALDIFERMGYDEAADAVITAIEAMDFPEGTY